jgi:hypothetical protein
MVTFTLPFELCAVAKRHPAEVYGLLLMTKAWRVNWA